MLRYIIYVSISILFIQCHSNKSVESISYPDVIIDEGLVEQYNMSKWYLYCILCDIELKRIEIKDDQYALMEDDSPATYGMLDLRFDTLMMKQDTIEMKFYFYQNSNKVDFSYVDNPPFSGTVFANNRDSITNFLTDGIYSYIWHRCDNYELCDSRLVKPLQPDVIKYIQDNEEVINPWFRAEAVKQGVITE